MNFTLTITSLDSLISLAFCILLLVVAKAALLQLLLPLFLHEKNAYTYVCVCVCVCVCYTNSSICFAKQKQSYFELMYFVFLKFCISDKMDNGIVKDRLGNFILIVQSWSISNAIYTHPLSL
jgi:hypothetical protein